MQIRSERACDNPACEHEPPHDDGEGLRLLGVPCWLIAFWTVMGMGAALLAYTAAVRLPAP